MKKLTIIPILFFAILLSGCIKDKEASSASQPHTPLVDKVQTSQTTFNPITDSQDGIEVTVENVKKENGKTTIELTLSNHRYDLSTFDIKSRSDFSGISPTDYIINDSTMGGHHIQVEMVFDGELSGFLTISLDDFLVFNFNI